MSVLMVLRMEGGDVETFERVAAEHADDLKGISERGRAAGAMHHAFFASDGGQLMVVDEWDSPENFQKFFESEAPNIGPLMQEVGAQPAAPEFYRKLETGDAF